MAKIDLENIKERLKGIRIEDVDSEDSIRLIQDIKKEVSRILKDTKKQEFKLEEKMGRGILHHFKGSFNAEELFDKYPEHSKESIVKALKKLVRQKKLEHIGWNLYSTHIKDSGPIIRLSEEMQEIQRLLNDNGINFIITGLDILQEYMNLLPKRMLHLIYVVRGSGEFAKGLIEKRLKKICMLNPSKREVRNMLAHYIEDIIVIREVGESSIEYHKEGIAITEKAIIDLYFETTRKRIPFEESELAYILKNTLPRLKIDYKKLLRAASRRNISSEFLRILYALNIKLSNDILPYPKG